MCCALMLIGGCFVSAMRREMKEQRGFLKRGHHRSGLYEVQKTSVTTATLKILQMKVLSCNMWRVTLPA